MVVDFVMMLLLGKYGKKLGLKGFMLNFKIGIVILIFEKVVEEFKKGKVNYRIDKVGVVYILVGKVFMDSDKLVENIKIVISLIKKFKLLVVKGIYI